MKFRNYEPRKRIYKQKKELRDISEKLFINEDLTPKKAVMFSKARKLKKDGKIHNTWTHDSIIYYTVSENDDKPKKILTEVEITKLQDKDDSGNEPQPSTSKD